MIIRDEHKDIYLKLEKILLSFKGVKLKITKHQNTFVDKYSTIVMIRSTSNEDNLTTAWSNGVKLEKSFDVFGGNGKYVRHIKYISSKDINVTLFRKIIKEAMTLNIEHYEMRKLRCNLSH